MTSRVSRSQILLTLAHGCRLALFILVTGLLGRRLAPVDFAFVSWVTGLYIVAMEALDLGTSAVATREIAAQPDRERSTLAALLALRRWLATLLAIVVLGLAFSPLVADESRRVALAAVAAGIYLLHLHAYQPVFQWRQSYGRVLVLGLTGQLGFLLASAAALKAQAGGAVIVLLIVVREAASALNSRWAAVRLLGERLDVPWRSSGMGRLLRQGWMIGLAGVSYKLVVFGGVFLLYRPDAPDALASFSAAHRLLIPIVDLAWLVVNPLFGSLSMAAAHGDQAFRDQMAGYTKLMLGLACVISVAMMFVAPFILRLFYGEAYLAGPASSVGPFRWLALGGIFAWVTPVFVVAESTRGHARALLTLSLTCLGLSAVGNILAIPHHGAEGAAMVLCGCEAVVFCALLARSVARRDIRLNAAWLAYLVPAMALAVALYLLDGRAVVQSVVAATSVPLSLFLMSKLPAQRICRASLASLSMPQKPSPIAPSAAHRQPHP
jgi:O-antigen/teichoic acid export membrane protein